MDDVRRLPVGEGSDGIAVTLDELACEGARRMIAAALKAEADDYVERFADECGEDGKRLGVRNGSAPTCSLTASTSRCGSARTTGCACSWSSVCARTASRNCSPSRMATARAASP